MIDADGTEAPGARRLAGHRGADALAFTRIRCAQIHPDPRRDGDCAASIEALAESIRQLGLLRPVLVKPSGDGYQIVHGERRWRAACAAGLDLVPAYIVEVVRDGRAAVAEPA